MVEQGKDNPSFHTIKSILKNEKLEGYFDSSARFPYYKVYFKVSVYEIDIMLGGMCFHTIKSILKT